MISSQTAAGWVFIDYENVHYSFQEISSLQQAKYFFFIPQKQIEILTSKVQNYQNFILIPILGNGKNNLDFHLSFYLGLKHFEAPAEVEFLVLSKDKGFSRLIEYIVSLGRKCRMLTSLPGDIKQAPVKQNILLEKIRSNLKKIKKPAHLAGLTLHISHLLKQDETSAKKIIDELLESGYIFLDQKNRIHYRID